MISFVIPVYNKDKVLSKSLNTLISLLNKRSITDYEILIINDGSTDNSLTEALRFKRRLFNSKKIKIFHYNKNTGKGFAMRFGFYQSKGDPIIYLDGDMDIDTREVLAALEVYLAYKPDMVLGSKYHPYSRVYYPFNRYVYSLVLKSLIRILFNVKISDTQVGLKIFKREVLARTFPRLIIKQFAADLEILVVASQLGYQQVLEIPVHIRHTSANQSTINTSAVRQFCIDIAAIWYRKNILQYYKIDTSSRKLSAIKFERI